FASSTGAAICAEGVEDLDDLRALVSLDVTYAQGYGLCRPGPAWPAPNAEATAAGAADIRSGLRVATTPRGAAGAFAHGLAELCDELSRVTTLADLASPNLRAADLLGADEVALMLVDHTYGELELLTNNTSDTAGERWTLDAFPATRYVLEPACPARSWP